MKPLIFWQILLAKLLLVVPFIAATGCTSDHPEFDNYKHYVEDKNGISCAELNLEAMEFVQVTIRPLILAGRSGKDWVTMSDKGMLDAIRSYEEKTFLCDTVKANSERLGISMPGEFNALHKLFSTLNIFITPWCDKAASIKSLKPEAFERVDSIYRNLPYPSSGTR